MKQIGQPTVTPHQSNGIPLQSECREHAFIGSTTHPYLMKKKDHVRQIKIGG